MSDHYRRLARERVLVESLCWTVVVPDDGAAFLTLEEVGARLSGGTGYELHQAAPLSAIVPYGEGPCPVAVDRAGSTIVLYEYDYLGSLSGVLRRLSANARVYSAWWNVNAVNRLSLAIGGKVLLTINGRSPGRPENHPNLAWWPELAAMTDFFADFEERDDGGNWRADFFTAIELATGARLSREWLDAEHPYLTFSGSVAD